MKVAAAGLILLVAGMAFETYKPLPSGMRVTGQEHLAPASSVRFLADRTYVNAAGQRVSEQEIFDEVISMIRGARRYILVDMFLYNDFQGEPPERERALAAEVTAALMAAKQQYPDIVITVVSDPLNTVYGGAVSPHFEQLKAAGVAVVITDLKVLRDSNPLYSVFWRLAFGWLRNSTQAGLMPHPFGAGQNGVTVRSWLALLNFKANHRKIIVADEPQKGGAVKMATLVTSANPHDGSSAHSNVAIKVADHLWREAIASEQAVGAWSGAVVAEFEGEVADGDGEAGVQLLTEGAIADRVVELINAAGAGDSIDIVMFYLSERAQVKALLAAAERGVDIRLILDPNKDAFGHIKNGVPNRPVAHELVTKSKHKIQVRWCDTHGEQCHSKLVLWRIGEEHYLTAGSANFTRRNIGDFNLETNVLVAADSEIAAIESAREYFEELWANQGGKFFTTEYAAYADGSRLKTLMYRIQEASGLSSF